MPFKAFPEGPQGEDFIDEKYLLTNKAPVWRPPVFSPMFHPDKTRFHQTLNLKVLSLCETSFHETVACQQRCEAAYLTISNR